MLIKKELTAIPLMPPPEPREEINFDFLCAAGLFDLDRSGTVLVVDVYRGRNQSLYCRFISDGTIYYTCMDWPATCYGKSNPANIWYGRFKEYSEEHDTEIAESFLGKDRRESWRSRGLMGVIDAFVEEKVKDKRQRAADNAMDMKKRHFDMYPAWPADLESYCEEQVFGHTYIFYEKLDKRRQRYGRCGHCGHSFLVSEEVKANRETRCPKCGKAAIYKAAWQRTRPEDKAKMCIASRVEGQLLLRWVDISRIFLAGGAGRHYRFEPYAYNLHLTEKRGKKTIYAYGYQNSAIYGVGWKRFRNGTQNFSSSYVYTENLSEVFGEKYYNVNLQAGLEGRRIQICFTELLNNLQNMPVAEYLFKLGMPLLAADRSLCANAHVHKWRGFAEVLGVSKQMLPMYSAMDVTPEEHSVIEAYGKWVSTEDLLSYRKLRANRNDTWLIRDQLKTMSFQKLIHYFGKQKEISQRSINYLMTQYRDYLSMAKSLKIDLSRKSVRYPENICQAHDAVLKEFNRLKFTEENNAFAVAVSRIYPKLPITEMENDRYCMALPRLRTDLSREGQSLGHCVGAEGYAKNHMEGKRLIVFIRKIQDREKPFFTMEVDMEKYYVVQIHGRDNCSPPPDVRKFADSIVEALNPKSKNRIGGKQHE